MGTAIFAQIIETDLSNYTFFIPQSVWKLRFHCQRIAVPCFIKNNMEQRILCHVLLPGIFLVPLYRWRLYGLGLRKRLQTAC